MVDTADIERKWLRISAFGADARRGVYRKIVMFMEENQAPIEAIRVMRAQAQRRNAPIGKILASVEKSIKDGKSLSGAFAPWVPANELVFMAVGETADTLAVSLRLADEMMTQNRALKREIIDAISGPLFQIGVAALLVIAFSLGLAPKMKPMMDKVDVPPDVTVAFFGFADAVQVSWPFVLLGMIAVIVGIYVALPNWSGPVRTRIDGYIAPFSTYRWVQGSMFLISLGAMMKAGVAPRESILQLMGVSTRWFQYHARRMLGKIAAGNSVADAMADGLLPRAIAEDVVDFGALSGFERAIDAIGRESVADVRVELASLGKKVGIAAKMVIFGFVLWALAAFGQLIMAIQASLGV
ncbi:type II secretion system F family protein [Alcanivorax sp. 1008]|uniref:type II secretion system F family protein n=1 Tax=Alcanivorax sp. 1008 TaxID=2816853 RepID=UPI001D274543|nr:type II secretion system F family protein [Alcanivorax sp. 1008]MCC1496721.1 type II secretion system F family protein [Alcanivorax sp. 1008]